MSAQLSPSPFFRGFDSHGAPLAFGMLFTYAAGSSTPQVSYTDSTQAAPNPNPLQLNFRGEATLWLDPGLRYRLLLQDRFGNLVWEQDDVPGGAGISSPSAAAYPTTQAETAAGIAPVDLRYPEGTVDRYGINAVPGTTDMTRAIQAAVNVLNNWDVLANVSPNKNTPGPDTMQGGSVRFLGAVYGVSDTIRLAPNVYLQGIGGRAGNGPAGGASGRPVTVLKALPGFPKDQYVVDGAPWRIQRNDGTRNPAPYRVVKYDDLFTGKSGGGDANPSPVNSGINDIAIDGSHLAFGGYRNQLIFYAHSNNFHIYNVCYVGIFFCWGFEHALGRGEIAAPIGLFIDVHESFMQDTGELTIYAQPSPSWVAANQAIINAAFYWGGFAARVGTPWGGLSLKQVMLGCPQATFGFFAGNAGDVGFDVNGRLNILHWENEYTGATDNGAGHALFVLTNQAQAVCRGLSSKCQCALATGDANSRLIIYTPQFIQPAGGKRQLSFTPFASETRSTFEIQLHNPIFQDMEMGAANFDCSVVNATRIYGSVASKGASSGVPLVLIADALAGNPSSAGAGAIKGTVDAALTFIENNPHIRRWEIVLEDAQTHSISSAHRLVDQDVTFTRSFTRGNAFPVLTMSAAPVLQDCTIRLGQVIVSGWTSTAAFQVTGTTQITWPIGEAVSPVVSIPAKRVFLEVHAGTISACDILLSGSGVSWTFGTGSALCSAVNAQGQILYRDAFNVGFGRISGTPAIEAVTSGRVKVLASTLAPASNFGVTAALATGATVPHGLAGTPVVVTLQALDGVPTAIYPSAMGPATFTVNFSGGGTHAFAWTAKLASAAS